MPATLQQRPDRRVIAVAADAIAAVDPATPRDLAVELLNRSLSPDFQRWRRLVSGAGFCARPVRMTGRKVAHTTEGQREVLYATGDEPDGQLLIRCGNRRVSVCPPCSRTYAGDVWHLLHAGVAGGTKGVPASVAGHPMWFVTLTGPSFGAVHGERCGSGRGGRSASGGRTGRDQVTCLHGRTDTCSTVHAEGDPQLGEPVCPDCYDYPSAVAFNWHARELWRRFTIAVRRGLAQQLGVAESRLPAVLRVSYAKVAEFQRRGVVHFHAIIRLDGPATDGSYAPPPAALRAVNVPAVIRAAAADVAVDGGPAVPVLRFGVQTDIRHIATDLDQIPDDTASDGRAGPVTAGMVAAYIAKYATKAAEDFGLHAAIRTSAAAKSMGLRPHIAAMILAGEQLAQRDSYGDIARWLHMLGFRGHFTTKSRCFSVTLGELRQVRRDHQAAKDQPAEPATSGADGSEGAGHDGDELTVVVGEWRFLGLGHLTAGDAVLAARAHAEHLENLIFAAEARQT